MKKLKEIMKMKEEAILILMQLIVIELQLKKITADYLRQCYLLKI